VSVPSPVTKAMGGLLILLGGLWVLLTGGCTLYFVASAIQSTISFPSSSGGGGVAFFVVIGVVCIAPGVAAIWGGVSMLRSKS
jgi:hypothetical protein